MTNLIRNYLARLYSPDQVETSYRKILSVIQEAQGHIPTLEDTPFFSEQDIVLITYGDSLRRAAQEPLRVLHEFVRGRLSGVILTIHLLPFFPYSSDDGFSVTDYYAVDPALGTWENIESLGEDFQLMFDAVFNHMSAQSAWFAAFLADDPEFAGMFRTESPDANLDAVTRPRTTPLLVPFTKHNGETIHVWTTFSADQVDFDVRHPQTLLALLKILLFYVEKGARIIRLDAIAYLWKTVGTSSIHLEETHVVIQLMRAVLDEAAPHVSLITETNVPHKENISYFGDGHNEAQMVYNFTLPPLLFHTMLCGDVSKLCDWLNGLRVPSQQTTFFNFTASHDGIGVRPVEGILSDDEIADLIAHVESRGGRVSYKNNADGSRSPYEINSSYVDAITDSDEPVELQVKRFLVSQAIALSMAGVPGIYIHSLLGSHNNLNDMQRSGQNRSINRQKLDMDAIDAELRDDESFRAQVFSGYVDLIKKRRELPAFHPNAHQEALDLGDSGVLAIRRSTQGGSQQILAIFNVTNQTRDLDLSAYIQETCRDIISGDELSAHSQLLPYQIRWLLLRSDGV